MSFKELHLTELNEFLITGFLKYKTPIEIDIKDFTVDGYIKIDINKSDDLFDKESIDFDLQGCECSGLNENGDLSEFLGKTLHTASVYEFIEYFTGSASAGKLLIYIESGSWLIKVLTYS